MDWIVRQKRIFLHFMSTGASWLNPVERFCGTLTEKHLQRGVFQAVQDVELSLTYFIRTNSENTQPLVQTKTADEILKKDRARQESAGRCTCNINVSSLCLG